METEPDYKEVLLDQIELKVRCLRTLPIAGVTAEEIAEFQLAPIEYVEIINAISDENRDLSNHKVAITVWQQLFSTEKLRKQYEEFFESEELLMSDKLPACAYFRSKSMEYRMWRKVCFFSFAQGKTPESITITDVKKEYIESYWRDWQSDSYENLKELAKEKVRELRHSIKNER